MTDIYEEARNRVRAALSALSLPADTVTIEHPADLARGDLSTNAAMVYGKQANMNPFDLAQKIAVEILKTPHEWFDRVEVARPGFVNFYLSKNFFAGEVARMLEQGDGYGKNDIFGGKNVIIEYTDPNPFKELHVGHLMNNTIGESLSRIFAWSGGTVRRANYQGDVGLHVAKAVWALKNKKAFGEAYADGAKAFEEDENAKKEIIAINKKIYDRSDEEINHLYDEGRKLSLEYFETIYARLGTKFDFYFFESETGIVGKKLVEEHVRDGVFEKSDGAIVFKGERYGLHTRVFINADDLPTYEAKELGLATMKHEKFPYEYSFIVTGNEIAEYFKVLKKVLALTRPELAAKMTHIPHGMLRLPSGKMSSRTGDVISAGWLIDEAKHRVYEKVKEGRGAEAVEAIAEDAAVGAVKYSILRQAVGRDIIFDFDTSLSFEGNSGPYVQYTHARAHSIGVVAREKGIAVATDKPFAECSVIERLLCRFPATVARSAAEREPHHIVTYATDLARDFNAWYAAERIVDAENNAPYRVAVAEATKRILKNCLHLLGIPAPEKM